VAFALPQLLVTVNTTLPDTADAPQVVVMELVPCPAVMVTPVGAVQLYVTPDWAVVEYT
jgi:hypothetical protein